MDKGRNESINIDKLPENYRKTINIYSSRATYGKTGKPKTDKIQPRNYHYLEL